MSSVTITMLNKLFPKVTQSPERSMTLTDLEPRVAVHYGIPSTASILAFDPIQHLLAIGTLDGRIKVIGGDNIEALLVSPKSLPFKNLEFLHNQGFLVSVSNENEVQVWDLEHRRIATSIQWESNITAFSVIYGFQYMYVGDEYGFLSVLKYDAEEGKVLQLPYYITASLIADGAGISLPDHQSIVGVLPQPCSSGNRVLIAYENGFIILWDVTVDRAVLVRGYKDLQLKDEIVIDSLNDVRREHIDVTSDNEQAEKEISSLCWVSSDGSILAVGYVDGDILLWNLSTAASTKEQKGHKSSSNVIKLQLSSAEKRLPVIVLHWYSNSAHKGPRGQLFVYGGDEIGSEEVLTILSLDWSSGIETLKCIDRVDLTLGGSFADMSLIPNGGAAEHSDTSALFVLTNPGQLHFYDDASLSALMSNQDKKYSINATQYPVVIPTMEPNMTVGKLSVINDETISAAKLQGAHTMTTRSTKWPLTGGISSQLSSAEDNRIKRIYIGGYQDGSVRIWDATFPVLSLIFVLGSNVEGIEVTGSSASISALEFSSSSSTLILAIGNECGLVRLHRLMGSSDETSFHFVTETKHEVHNIRYGHNTQCTDVFSILDSPVRSLQFSAFGARLAVGFECGRVAMLDVSSSSFLFLTDCASSSNSPVISLAVKACPDTCNNSLEPSANKISTEPLNEVAFILTKDAHIVVMDSTRGDIIGSQLIHPKNESTALSMYILEGNISISEVSEKHSLISSQDSEAKTEPAHTNQCESDEKEVKVDDSNQTTNLGQRFTDSFILLCCEDVLQLYSVKSVLQGENSSICRMNLMKPCCWTTLFKRDEKGCGLILVYQTGIIEIRSLPDLEVVGETSLTSILRWNFKTNMDKMMSSSSTGQITMVNGCEFAFISLLAFENDFRIPEALPCLHDKVLAAAADSAVSSSLNEKKQITTMGIFGGIIKGFNVGKADQSVNLHETRENVIAHLESIFSRFPFSDSVNISDGDLTEFNIDDIEIDEPLPLPSSSINNKDERKDKEQERERLFEGGSTDSKPKLRTAEEIRAKYRKTGDASTAAAQAKDKLIERQEKLERLSRNTEELQSGAENFASMANELAKRMENRKWWQI